MKVSSDGYIRNAERHKIIRQAVHHCRVKIECKLHAARMLWLEMHFVFQHHLKACAGQHFSVSVRFNECQLRVCFSSEIKPQPYPSLLPKAVQVHILCCIFYLLLCFRVIFLTSNGENINDLGFRTNREMALVVSGVGSGTRFPPLRQIEQGESWRKWRERLL